MNFYFKKIFIFIYKNFFNVYSLLGIPIIFYPILHFGNIQFPGMDGGVLIHAAWQYHLGYVPYKDFITLVPPGFLIGAKWAFDLFGASWNSQLWFLAIFSYITFLIQYLIFTRFGISRLFSFLIAIFIQLTTNIVIGFWWYNHLASLSATLFISSAFLFYKNPKILLNNILFISTLFILMLMKINIAGLLIIMTFSILVISGKTRVKTILNGIITLAITSLFLLSVNINPVLLVNLYKSGANRFDLNYFFYKLNEFAPIEFYWTKVFITPLIIGLFILIFQIFINGYTNKVFKEYRIYLLLVFIGFLACLFGWMTNSDLRIIETPVFIVPVVMFIFLLSQEKIFEQIKNYFSISGIWFFIIFSVILLGLQAITMVIERDRVEATGDFYKETYQNLPQGTFSTENKFFNNFTTTSYFFITVNSMEALKKVLIQESMLDGNKIYFGPRVNFGYALYGIKPPKGFPLWWGEEPRAGGVPEGYTPQLIRHFEKTNFSLAVTVIGDLVFHPKEIVDYLNNNYKLLGVGDLAIWINPEEEKLYEELFKISNQNSSTKSQAN